MLMFCELASSFGLSLNSWHVDIEISEIGLPLESILLLVWTSPVIASIKQTLSLLKGKKSSRGKLFTETTNNSMTNWLIMLTITVKQLYYSDHATMQDFIYSLVQGFMCTLWIPCELSSIQDYIITNRLRSGFILLTLLCSKRYFSWSLDIIYIKN